MIMDNGQLVPKLRFSEFGGEWKKKELKSIVQSVDYRGKGPTKSDSGVFLVTAKNIKKGFIDYNSSKEYIPIENYDLVMSKGKPNVGDIVFTTEAPMGNVAVLDKEKIALAQRVIKFRVKEQLNNMFLLFNLLCPETQKKLSRLSIGSTVKGISNKDLHKVKIAFPKNFQEQQKIANFLTAIDQRITQLKEKKAALESYKKGLMQKIFSQEIRFADDEGNEFPEWEEKKLKDVFSRSTLKNRNNKISNVFTNSAKSGIVNQMDFFDHSVANKNNLEGYYVVNKDDFVYNPRISKSAPVGPLKRNKLETGAMSPLYTVLNHKLGNKTFLEYYFESSHWHRFMCGIANYGARHDRMNIQNNDFMKLPIPYPCLEEQQKIADFMSAMDQKINAMDKQIADSELFKKGLLQRMFV